MRWAAAELRANLFKGDNGEAGFEVRDDRAGFIVRCLDSIVVGDNKLVVPQR